LTDAPSVAPVLEIAAADPVTTVGGRLSRIFSSRNSRANDRRRTRRDSLPDGVKAVPGSGRKGTEGRVARLLRFLIEDPPAVGVVRDVVPSARPS
jgi:hypothetical protein